MKLKPPPGITARPTADRVKEALFSILNHRLEGALFLDFFAGSGAIGIEALSRGAKSCIFVESRKDNRAVIEENLKKTGMADMARIVNSEAAYAIVALARENIEADLAFLDPPYGEIALDTLVESLCGHGLVRKSGLVIVEHAYTNRQWSDRFAAVRLKKYGNTALTFIAPEQH